MKTAMPIKRFGRRGLLIALIALIVLLSAGIEAAAQTPPLEKRTLFMIGHHQNMNPFKFPLMAYVIVGDDLYHADTWNATDHGIGAVGLAIDENNENLFVSYESHNGVEVFDARTATPLGSIILYGTTNLAGMVVHQDRGQLFVVDRGMPTVYVFDTTNFNQVDSWVLPSGNGPYGLDLMDNWLFVGDGSTTVRWYDIDTGLEVGSFTQNVPAVGVAVTDWPELTVYSAEYPFGTSAAFTKYLVNSGIEQIMRPGNDTKGVSINPALQTAYVSVDNKLMVIDTETMTIMATKQLNFLWSPCDTLTSFVPFGGTVKKTSPSHPNGNIYKGDTVEFKVSIQNRHDRPIHVLPVTDEYDTSQLTFVSADPATDDNNNDGVLDWSDVIAQVGQDLPTGDWVDIEVTFEAIQDCEDELTGFNTAIMHDVKDDEQTTLPDASGQFDYVINCKCRNNLDCDDGLFCNGQEICNAQGECESPGNPCPLDDGLWCNGTETDQCDEQLDECGHENVPCEDDGTFCNGVDVCNENTDTCSNPGPPCTDDGQFCNGTETCDEQAAECTHSGDPCGLGEECNEATDQCDAGDLTDDDTTEDPEEEDEDLWPKGKVTGGCCGC